jgi:flagellar biogenesis protein FliO
MRCLLPSALLWVCLNPARGAPAAAIPFKPDNAAGVPWSGAGLAVILVSAVAIAAVLVVRKRLRFAPASDAPRLLRVLETERLGPRATLSVVEFKGQHYLLSQGEHGVTCLVAPPAGAAS